MDAQVGDNQKELLFRVLDETLHEIDEVDKGRHVRRALVDLEPYGTAMAASGSLISFQHSAASSMLIGGPQDRVLNKNPNSAARSR